MHRIGPISLVMQALYETLQRNVVAT